jgi:hypothetical protein
MKFILAVHSLAKHIAGYTMDHMLALSHLSHENIKTTVYFTPHELRCFSVSLLI